MKKESLFILFAWLFMIIVCLCCSSCYTSIRADHLDYKTVLGKKQIEMCTDSVFETFHVE